MKHIIRLLVIFPLLAASCARTDLPEEPAVMRTLTFTALMERDGQPDKASVSDAGALTWQEGDRIAVLDDAGAFNEFTLRSGAGTATATFTGQLPSGRHAAGVAVFPWNDSHEWSASEGLKLYLPASYSSAEAGKALMPMTASFATEEDPLHFRHAGGLLRLTLQSIPASATSVRLSSRGHRLNGAFLLGKEISSESAAESDATVESDSTVTVNFSRTGSEMSFSIPLPCVSLTGFTVDLYDSSGSLVGRKHAPATQNVPRGCLLKMPAVSLTPVSEYQCLKFIEYNVLQGMINDYPNDMDNFVTWVNRRNPDVLVICEGKTFGNGITIPDYLRPMPNRISTLAARWGHSYTAVGAQQDNFPVLVTSRYPITLVQRLEGSDYSHGGLHVRVAGFDVVAIHLYPEHTAASDEEQRISEITAATEATIQNPSYASRENWILTGDMNSYYRGDPKPNPKPHNLLAQDYIHSNWDHDVLYEKNGGAWQPTMYHGNTRVDYFFVSDAVYPFITEARVLHDDFTDSYTSEDQTKASDHRPLQIIYERAVFEEGQDAGIWNMTPVDGEW